MVAKFNLPAFIATLGMMTLARGTALSLCTGRPISGYSVFIKFLGSGKVGGVFIPIIIMLVIYVIAYIILSYTQFGRNIYAVGGSAEASRLSGVNVGRTTLLVFIASGFLAGLAGVLLTGRLNSAQPTAGYNYEMDAIASAVIGGTSMSGGEGKVFGTLVGAVIIQILRNGLNLLNVSSYLQQIVIGIVIIIAVFVDVYRTKQRG
jgi:ribose transport system permease protein